jgi:hypothetical protein
MKRNIVVILFAVSWMTGLWAKGEVTNSILDIYSESSEADSVFSGYEITPEGAWCWFADPRALYYENESGTIRSTYIGYIDVHGNIKATQYDYIANRANEVLVRSCFQPDDHNNPTFLVLPDERIMVFYSRHTDEPCFYYRVSRKAGDITTLGEEKKLMTKNNTTYPSPFILSADPHHIYLCWRGIEWHPTIARILIPDMNGDTNFDWGPYQMVQSTGARPYAKYMSNGKDRIYMTYTTGHPDNEQPNYVYFNYVDINDMKLKDIQGKVLSVIQNAPHRINKKNDYISAYPAAVVEHSNFRNWVWELALDVYENPVIAMVRISPDKTKHDYYYVKWTGKEWKKTYLAYGGKHFHQTPDTERCYSGGMSIDKRFPEQVYCSVPVKGEHGTVYEIVKYSVDTNGKVTQEAVTYNSEKNNVRPYCLQNMNSHSLGIVWMYGDYYDWIVSSARPLGYSTAIHGICPLPVASIELDKGLLKHISYHHRDSGMDEQTGMLKTSAGKELSLLKNNSANAFTVSLSLCISPDSYSGNILKLGNLTYALEDTTLKPVVIVGNSIYKSTNILGNSNIWKKQKRVTDGKWHVPQKLKTFNLSITYAKGELCTFLNGLLDQTIAVDGLVLGDVILGGFNGHIAEYRIYDRKLSQDEVRILSGRNGINK